MSESQLIQYYISSIMEKVRAKTYSLEDAIKVSRDKLCTSSCVFVYDGVWRFHIHSNP